MMFSLKFPLRWLSNSVNVGLAERTMLERRSKRRAVASMIWPVRPHGLIPFWVVLGLAVLLSMTAATYTQAQQTEEGSQPDASSGSVDGKGDDQQDADAASSLPPFIKLSRDQQQSVIERGSEAFTAKCAECHGDQGQGVEGLYDDPLVGDLSVRQLAGVIDETMPEGDPEYCEGDEATAVAAFIHQEFYSEAAQIRNRPPREVLARLTATQLRQSLADLYAHLEGHGEFGDERGVRAIYFKGDRWKNENKKIERVDPVIDFDWGYHSPGEDIEPESFYVYWEGGLLAPETGSYEIVVRSTCSFVMNFGRLDREFINNHVQSGDKTEFRKTVRLTAGRIYPFKIDFRQRERKTENPPARISLSWVPPHGTEEIIPQHVLVARGARPTFSLQTQLPPDDRSYGFERGIAVNPQWDNSTTEAALEFAEVAIDELWPEYRKRHKDIPDEGRARMKAFLEDLLQVAFRGYLPEQVKQLYIDRQLEREQDDAEAIKRVLLMALKSPRFLYPTISGDVSTSQVRANRLALVLFDSLPSGEDFEKAIAENQLESDEQVRQFVRKMVDDPRVRAKTRDMLHEWLNLSHIGDLTKDEQRFPGFEQELISDLRDSLNRMLEEIVWDGSGDYRQLFNAKWSYSTLRMAKFYGDPWMPQAGQGMQRTAENSERRYGILTHPYLLSGLAYHDATSPIHRGVFLIRHVLGRTLRPPQDAFSPLSPDLHPDLTTRQRVEKQTSPESCQVCHSRINGLGFTLESYDAVGRFREKEGEKPIDPTGEYISTEGELVKFAGISDLADYLTHSDDAHRALVSRAFQHFVKQPAAAYGPETLERLTHRFKQSGFKIPDLLVEIAVVASQPPEPNDQDIAQSGGP